MARRKAHDAGGWWGRLLAWLSGRALPMGARGEAHAARYLKQQGMKILARNRRKGKGEIDLIALDGEWVVFVEVRTRASEEFMTPEESVRFHKRRTVSRTTRKLMRKHQRAGLRPRIDLVAIVWPEGAAAPTAVRHHRAAMPVATW